MTMVIRPLSIPLAEAQAEVLADTREHHAALRAAQDRLAEYPGWMFWKKYPTGRSYLVHAYDRTGRGTTLGGDTPENTRRLEQFKHEQDEAKQRLKVMKERMTDHGRYIKAARLNRFPRRAGAVMRALAAAPERRAVLLGAHALFAYELMMGVLFTPALTEDAPLVIALETDQHQAAPAETPAAEKAPATVAEILKQADRSFVMEEGGGVAVSKSGFRVELLDHADAAFTARRNPLERSAPLIISGLRNEPGPTMRALVIDEYAWPLEVTVPDPRVFAAHQSLLAQSEELDADKREMARYIAEAMTEALRARRPKLPPLEPFPSISDTATLGAILNDTVLAGKQEIHR